MVPSSIGPYRIIEGLGSGANGGVYLAEDTRLGRKVAVKTLIAVGAADAAEARRWLLREARAAARLNHPNIASVYDVLESPSGAHIVMEYVRGETLAARVREGPLPPAQVMEIGIQLAEALGEAHAMGVVHRDLKPGNAVLTPKGHVKILDFGLAKVGRLDSVGASVGSSGDFTLDGQQVGTPPYMPPEHLMGDPFDARGDIYSLGVMLFEMLTGRRPFRGPDAMALVSAILTEPTPHAREINPRVPPGLDAVVYRAMARRPQERYATARELAYDLRRVAAGDEPLPVGLGEEATGALGFSVDPSAPTRSRLSQPRLGRRTRPAALLALGALCVLVVHAAVAPPRPPPAPADGTPVVAVLPLAADGDDSASVATGLADSLISGLSHVPGITVISRAATLPYLDRKKAPDVVARELGATMILDGSVQRAAERVRVTMSLLRPGSNVVLWTNEYDGTLADVFALQSDVAAAVVDALSVRLSSHERNEVEKPPTRNMAAFADYVQGRTFFDRPDVKGNLERSIDLFRSAIAKDPRFARAHAALGEAYWRRFKEEGDKAAAVAARDSTAEAMRLDANDASVRYTLGRIYRDTGRIEASIEELRNAIRIQPGNDEAHDLLGQMLAQRGELDTGLAEIRKAIALRPNYWGHYFAMGSITYAAGRFTQAVAAFQRVTELQPDSGWGFQMLGTSYHALDDTDHALANYRRAIQLGNAKAYSNLGVLYFDKKQFADAARAYEEAIKLEPNSPLKHRMLGDCYSRLGERSRAEAEYRRVLALGHDALQTNTRDESTLSTVAVAEAKLGMTAEARRDAAAAVALRPTSWELLYRQAVVHAVAGRIDEGLAALQAALAHGYSPSRALKDDDLAVLTSRPEFRVVAARMETVPSRGGQR